MTGELAAPLRRLRDETGRSLRELARDVHVSSSSLSRRSSGQAVPPWPTVVALCGVAGRGWSRSTAWRASARRP